MDGPCVEITVAKVGSDTVEDASTEDGKRYLKAFHDGATGNPGCERGFWEPARQASRMGRAFFGYEDSHRAPLMLAQR